MHDKLNRTRCFVAGKVGLGWGYDHAKPDVEGTNVRPKNFRSGEHPTTRDISRTAIGRISRMIGIYSYTPALWGK